MFTRYEKFTQQSKGTKCIKILLSYQRKIIYKFFDQVRFSVCTGSILDIGGMGAFFGGIFSEKGHFCLLAPPKQMSFLTISNENIFFEFQNTRSRIGLDVYFNPF